ncbi:MAG: hypothetical protein PWQ12_391 [Clostridiales bacterium]|jgi:ACT domain-containing protein|nr:hypothetical protein [Clostridiales bacterium]
MKGIITVLGNDRVGIIAGVCSHLAESNVNILDISQTIVKGFFNMVMIVDLDACNTSFEGLADDLGKVGESLGVAIKIQHEDIFNTMHRI